MTDTILSKWEMAISKLVEFTQDGKLDWKIVNPKEYLPNVDTEGAMLIVKYEESHLLLYKKAFMKPSGNLLSAMSGVNDVKAYGPKLSVYNISEKVVIYDFPYTKLLEDLYKAATFNAAKIDELISSILGEASKQNLT